MKYQIGDEIIVLHSNEEGKIIDIISETMVMIEVRGVRFPAYMDQIDFPYFYRFSKKKIVEAKTIENFPKEKPQPNQLKTENGVWLVIIPKFSFDEFDDEIVELLKINLVNKTNNSLIFSYNNEFNGSTHFKLKAEIISFHDFYIHDLMFEHINDSPNFNFVFSLKETNKLKNDFFETSLKLKPKQIFHKIEQMKIKNESSFSFKLFEAYPDRIFEEYFDMGKLANKGFKVYDATKIKENTELPRSVVDLHIEKLTDDWSRKSNIEILNIQLKEFEKWFHISLIHHQQKLIIIHGIGKGKLKDEIHNLLKLKKEVKSFVNQYDERFGYGATEIFFQY